MFGLQRKQLDLDQKNQDQRWEGERADTCEEARKASKSSPCSSGKNASSEPGGPWNKGSVSCLPAISSETQSPTAELAMTSKIPHRGEPPLASRSFFQLLFQGNKTHNKHRSEHVKDRVSNGSTHGEASKQSQSQDILKRKNKMKHLFNKTNTEEIIDCERPSSAETLEDFLGGTTTVPHLSTFDKLSSESEEEEADTDSASRQETYGESDVITFPWTLSQSSSASTSFSRSTRSLRSSASQLSTSTISGGAPVSSDRYSLISLLEQTKQPHVAPLPPTSDRVNMSFVACTHQRLRRLQSNCRRSQTSPASSPRTGVCQRPFTLVNREEDAVQKGSSTTDTAQSLNETWGSSTSEQLDNLNVDDMMKLRGSEEAARGGAPAALNAQDSNKEIVCRPQQRLLVDLPAEEEEGQCRICHCSDSLPTNPLLSPCLCSGSLQFIHLDCLKIWIQTKIQSGSLLCVVQRCELCLGRLMLDPDTFDLDDQYRRHQEEKQAPQQMDMTELNHLLEETVELQELTNRLLLSRTLGIGDTLLPSLYDVDLPMISYRSRTRLRRIRRGGTPHMTLDPPPYSVFFLTSWLIWN